MSAEKPEGRPSVFVGVNAFCQRIVVESVVTLISAAADGKEQQNLEGSSTPFSALIIPCQDR